MRNKALFLLVALVPSLLIGCEYKHAKTEPPEILVSPYQKVQTRTGGEDPTWLLSGNPVKIFIQDYIGGSYFLNLDTGEKLPAPTGFSADFRTEHLIIGTATVPMSGHQGPFRIDLHGKTVVSEEVIGTNWGGGGSPFSLIKRERFTGEMVLFVNNLTVLRQQVTDMYLRDLYIDYNLEFGVVIFHYIPYPDGEPYEDPMSDAFYLIRIPASHEVKPKPQLPASGGVRGGRLNPTPSPSDIKRK